MHPAAVAPAQGALQVEHAGKAAVRRGARASTRRVRRIIGASAYLRLALGIGVGELQVAQLQLDFAARQLPLRLG